MLINLKVNTFNLVTYFLNFFNNYFSNILLLFKIMTKIGIISQSKTDNSIKLTEQDLIRLGQYKVKNLPFNYNT